MMNLKQHCSTKELIFQEELTLIKQVYQKNVSFVSIGVLKILDSNLRQIFVINVMFHVSFQYQKELKY